MPMQSKRMTLLQFVHGYRDDGGDDEEAICPSRVDSPRLQALQAITLGLQHVT